MPLASSRWYLRGLAPCMHQKNDVPFGVEAANVSRIPLTIPSFLVDVLLQPCVQGSVVHFSLQSQTWLRKPWHYGERPRNDFTVSGTRIHPKAYYIYTYILYIYIYTYISSPEDTHHSCSSAGQRVGKCEVYLPEMGNPKQTPCLFLMHWAACCHCFALHVVPAPWSYTDRDDMLMTPSPLVMLLLEIRSVLYWW